MSKSSRKKMLVTCGRTKCSYEMRARSTRGNVYGDTGGGPTRKVDVRYEAAHVRARRDLPQTGCALVDQTCKGRLEVALRPDAPREYLRYDETRDAMFYSGPDSKDGYRRLCRSHHSREGAAAQVIARISDPALAQAVLDDLNGVRA